MKYILVVLTALTLALFISFKLDQRYAEGVAHGVKTALHLPASEALEVACASLWVGEQNKKAAERGL